MRILLALFLLLLPAATVMAQDDADLQKRIELAEKIHALNPAQAQVSAAIDRIAAAQPEAEREAFKSAMRSTLDFRAIEKISIDAMAETYTAGELQVMLDYYSNPLAQSAVQKQAAWVAKVQPEIIKMLDAAMMRVRTGQ